MRLVARVDGDIRKMLADDLQRGAVAVTRSVDIAGQAMQFDLRQQIQAAGLGPLLARTIRQRTFPDRDVSLGAATLVWSNADKVIHAFDSGTRIRSKNGFYLAIPLPAAGTKGRNNKRITPALWEQKFHRRLQFVYRDGQPPLLVNPASVPKSQGGPNSVATPIFLLVPSVKMPKKLSVDGAAKRALNRLPGLIVNTWKDAA